VRLRQRARSGFTLLEVLLALGIFVASAAILSRLVLLGLENAEYARWQTRAWTILESSFAQLEAGILTLDDTGTSTVPDMPGWEVSMTTASSGIDYLVVVTFEARYAGAGPAQGLAVRGSKLVFDQDAASEANSGTSG
jgi:prepilin-type N-terminal cleavage/methylation domain-containing protein